jgi:hypothetical protein
MWGPVYKIYPHPDHCCTIPVDYEYHGRYLTMIVVVSNMDFLDQVSDK